jgi:hypothetical protein
MSMFADHKGEVRARNRHRELSPQTREIREALAETVRTGTFKVIPGTTEAEFKAWEGKLRAQAGQLDFGVKVRLTADKGEVAFKAHELEDVSPPTAPPPPAIVPTKAVTRASKKAASPPQTAPPEVKRRGPGRPRKNPA